MNHCAVAISLMSAAAFEELEESEANMLRARDKTEGRGERPQLFCANNHNLW